MTIEATTYSGLAVGAAGPTHLHMFRFILLSATLTACAEFDLASDKPSRTGHFQSDDTPEDPPPADADDPDEDEGGDDREESEEPEEDGDDVPDTPDTPKDPVVPEECNGEDDDGDGEIDEDFPDTDADGIADCVDTEECDGEDNDGDGLIDEGFDEDHDGTSDCEERYYDVDLHVTVDDTWTGTIDGDDITASSGWSGVDTFEWELDSGPHVITIHGEDIGEAITAFLASVVIDGDVEFVTGDGSWSMSQDGPEAGWLAPGFSDAHWDRPIPCSDTSPWGEWDGLPLDHGAAWVWYSPDGDCRSPYAWSEAWFRLEFVLP